VGVAVGSITRTGVLLIKIKAATNTRSINDCHEKMTPKIFAGAVSGLNKIISPTRIAHSRWHRKYQQSIQQKRRLTRAPQNLPASPAAAITNYAQSYAGHPAVSDAASAHSE
jgi:hypothetical protein